MYACMSMVYDDLPVGLARISLIFSSSASVISPALLKMKIMLMHCSVVYMIYLPLVQVNLCNFKNEVRESSTDTLNDSQGKHDLASTIDVGVLDSQNVSELSGSL